MSAVVTSAGPPRTSTAWARTDGPGAKWLLLRKPKHDSARLHNKMEAIEGDTGVRS